MTNAQCAELVQSITPEGYVTLDAYCREHHLDIVRMVALATWGYLNLKVLTVKPPRVKIGGSALRVLLIKAETLPHPFALSSRWKVDSDPRPKPGDPVRVRGNGEGVRVICERVGRGKSWVRKMMTEAGLSPGHGFRYTTEYVDKCVAVLNEMREMKQNDAVLKARRRASSIQNLEKAWKSRKSAAAFAAASENIRKGREKRVYRKAPQIIHYEGQEYISIEEAVRRFASSESTIRRRVVEGAIPGSIQIKPPGSKCRPSHYVPSDCVPVNSVI